MIAANPVNYGKEIKLTCAEALAGAVYLAGFQKQAHQIMSCFTWGETFFAINEPYFNRYDHCTTHAELSIA